MNKNKKHGKYSKISNTFLLLLHAQIQKVLSEGGPTLTFFLVDEMREDPNSTKSGPSSARQNNAILMRPKIECWLGSFVIFQGIQTSIAKKVRKRAKIRKR